MKVVITIIYSSWVKKNSTYAEWAEIKIEVQN